MKVLGRGIEHLDFALTMEVSEASQVVIDAVKQQGGEVQIKYRTPLKMREHLKPHLFRMPLAEPLPAKRDANRLEKLRRMGAKVEYREPKWVLEDRQLEEQEQAQTKGMKFPVKKYDNMGKDYVRKRKEKIRREISFKF